MRYQVILADPPWLYRSEGPWGASRHYRCLPTDSIAAWPIADLADRRCALFMWTTSSHLPDALQVMSAWGFSYHSIGFNWVKTYRDASIYMGMGSYTRRGSEFCLLGIKGRPKRRDRSVYEVLLAHPRQHSRKPDEQYERIMRLFDGPYLELFARQQWPGWDVWGNEAGKFPAQPFLLPESLVS